MKLGIVVVLCSSYVVLADNDPCYSRNIRDVEVEKYTIEGKNPI